MAKCASRPYLVLAAVAILALASRVQAAPNSADYADVIERLTRFIEHEREAKDLPAVSIALVDGDQIVWSRGFGSIDAVGERPATSDTVYRVGSVSKLFTDIAVMRLAREGRLDIDADIRTILPDFAPENPYGIPITLRQIMAHQSGLVREPPVGHYFDPDEPSLEATVRSLSQTKLVYKPGTRTKYSNAAIAVAGHVVELLVGKRFEVHIKETLLEPLAMKSSSFRLNDRIAPQVAQSWMWAHHQRRFESPTFPLGTLPAGNLYASVNDLGNFLIACFDQGAFEGKQVIPEGIFSAMMQPMKATDDKENLFGIGFRVSELDGHKAFGHGGAVYGYSTQVTGLVDEKLGVIAVCALDGSDGFVRRLAEYALRLALARRDGKPLPEIEITTPLIAGEADRLQGVYTSDSETLELQEFNDQLYLAHDYSISEVRRSAKSDADLIVDDPTVFGPKLTIADDVVTLADKTWRRSDDPCPLPCPERWRGLIGEYGWDHNVLYIYEDRGQLWALIEWFSYYPLTEISENVFAFPDAGLYHGEQIVFKRNGEGEATEAVAASVSFKRRPLGEFNGEVFRIRPSRSVEQLRAAAFEAEPPRETRPTRQPDLVDLAALDPTLKFDIRYAGTDNFMEAPFYESARAFMQRPAAEAVVRAHQKLKAHGYGLLIHDAYRPWFVTKMFWDATPAPLRHFVADPQQGSRHNRGCAVDLTLFDLKTGEPVEMVSHYDEFSPRSYPLYPGGDRRQRWLRTLLRNAMEAEGFTVYEFEWWHFDYRDWREYPILNVPFEEIEAAAP